MSVKHYSLGNNISLNEAVDIIYQQLLCVGMDDSKKNIKQRIRDGLVKKNGPLTVDIHKPFNAADFFTWAVKVKNWDVLKDIENLPLHAQVYVDGLQVTSSVGDAVQLSGLLSFEQIQQLQIENQTLKKKLQNITMACNQLQVENESLKQEKNERHRKQSDYGAQGGRGNEK